MLGNIELYLGRLRYVACPLCGEGLHRYRRDCGTTHRDYARCVSCNAHVGYDEDEHQEIVRELRQLGIGEPLIEYLWLEAGPIRLNDPTLTRNLGGCGEAAA